MIFVSVSAFGPYEICKNVAVAESKHHRPTVQTGRLPFNEGGEKKTFRNIVPVHFLRFLRCVCLSFGFLVRQGVTSVIVIFFLSFFFFYNQPTSESLLLQQGWCSTLGGGGGGGGGGVVKWSIL